MSSTTQMGSFGSKSGYNLPDLKAYGEIQMQVQPVPIIARRMAVLLSSVAAVDAVVALLAQHPAMWCAMIPGLIPLLTPVAIFAPHAKAAN